MFHDKSNIFQTNLSGMFQVEYIVWIYINISCICKNTGQSFKIWSAIIRINTKYESLIMKSSLGNGLRLPLQILESWSFYQGDHFTEVE